MKFTKPRRNIHYAKKLLLYFIFILIFQLNKRVASVLLLSANEKAAVVNRLLPEL